MPLTIWKRNIENLWKEKNLQQEKANPCVFIHPVRKLRVVIHGDDFTLLGHPGDLEWFREKVRQKFEIKVREIGPGTRR